MPCVFCGKEERGAAVEDIICSVCLNRLCTKTGRQILRMIEAAEASGNSRQAQMLRLLIGRSYTNVQKLKRRKR